MFSRYFLIAMVLFMTAATLSFAGDNDVFYYYFDEKIPLEKREDKAFVALYDRRADISNIIMSRGVSVDDYAIVEDDAVIDGSAFI